MMPAITAMPITIGPSEPCSTPVALAWRFTPNALTSATCHVPTAPTISRTQARPAPARTAICGRDSLTTLTLSRCTLGAGAPAQGPRQPVAGPPPPGGGCDGGGWDGGGAAGGGCSPGVCPAGGAWGTAGGGVG